MSVLVRSMDREQLREALASLALQTYPNIEVVVIAVRPGHASLPERCGEFPLRLVPTESPLPRSAAANRALDEARGEFLVFLDDDDWFMPGHVERLATVLQEQPHTLAAYTGVAFVGATGEPTGEVMDLPFDGVRQLAGNMTPIHAVMFKREALARGVRFDERLDHYEDWDFWLQMARHCVLTHLPGVSACYRIHQSSGVHDAPGPPGAATQQIYDKWQAMWRPDERASIMFKVWAAGEFEKSLQAARAEVAALREMLAQQQAYAESQNATIARQQEMLSGQHETLVGQHATLVSQHATLVDMHATIAQQQAALGVAQGTAAQQAQAIDRLQHEVNAHAATIAARESNIADLMSSTSWKVTAPLRSASRLLRRGG